MNGKEEIFQFEKNKWTVETPAASGNYWYRCFDGNEGLINIDKNLWCGEDSCSIAEIIEIWGITHWCGPIKPPPFCE